MVLDRVNERLPSGVRLGYGTLYLYLEGRPSAVERIASWRHIDHWHDLGIVSFVLSMGLALVTLLAVGANMIRAQPEPTPAQEPVNLLAIPGVNDFLPLSAAVYIVIALLIGAIAHEFAHAVAMRAEDVRIEEFGIGCLFLVPMAAYVKPDDEAFENASVRSRTRILAAGAYANLWVFLVTSLLFFFPWVGSPIDAFVVYFGAIYGQPFPTAETVASLGVATNLLFWTWFFNLNLAFVNVLPVAFLDGGRVVGMVGELVDLPRLDARSAQIGITAVATLGTIGLFVLAVFSPLLI